jgi:hypothetical protein
MYADGAGLYLNGGAKVAKSFLSATASSHLRRQRPAPTIEDRALAVSRVALRKSFRYEQTAA